MREAVRLRPDWTDARNSLGLLFLELDRLSEAETELTTALRLDATNHWAHTTLARLREKQGNATEVIRHLREAIRLKPDHFPAHSNLGNALYRQGKYRAATEAWADAFVRHPARADDINNACRYNAACSAALAAAGSGGDAPPDDKDRARLRAQALSWLRADLARRQALLDQAKPEDRARLQKTMKHWQTDPDLAGIREASALARLPEAERAPFQKLWADVAALLARSQ